jgi:hypothetical protein
MTAQTIAEPGVPEGSDDELVEKEEAADREKRAAEGEERAAEGEERAAEGEGRAAERDV